MKTSEINFLDIQDNKEYIKIINKVLEESFKEENLQNKNMYINIVLTNSENIRKVNKQYRNIDKPTDVLSFPMFKKEELENINNTNMDILGDIVIAIDVIEKQSIEYNHSFERELSYMVVHGFYHLLGYDHIREVDRELMRQKEENILNKIKIIK